MKHYINGMTNKVDTINSIKDTKGMSLRNYGNYVGTIVCLSFNNDFN